MKKSKRIPAKTAGLSAEEAFEAIKKIVSESTRPEEQDSLVALIINELAGETVATPENASYFLRRLVMLNRLLAEQLDEAQPAISAHARSRQKKHTSTIKLVNILEEKLLRMTLDEAIEDLCETDAWKHLEPKSMRTSFYLNRNLPGTKRHKLLEAERRKLLAEAGDAWVDLLKAAREKREGTV